MSLYEGLSLLVGITPVVIQCLPWMVKVWQDWCKRRK